MSGSSAHTVKPDLQAARAELPARARRKLPWKIVGLAVSSAAFGLAGAATLSHLRERPAPVMQIMSGNPALKKASDGESVRWHAAKSKIYFDASLDSAGPHAREVVQVAFGTWLSSGAKLPGVAFDSIKNARFGQVPNGKSEVMYGPITIAGHESDLALTVTFSDPKTGEVLESDMIFNSRYPYGVLSDSAPTDKKTASTASSTTDCHEQYDLQSVATHEAGHFFGLGEDFEAKPATMYYTTGRCETHKRVLQSSDETTIAALYLANNQQAAGDEASAKGCGGASIGQGRTTGATPIALLFGVLGLVAIRRARRRPDKPERYVHG